jgi:hypothetical protein
MEKRNASHKSPMNKNSVLKGYDSPLAPPAYNYNYTAKYPYNTPAVGMLYFVKNIVSILFSIFPAGYHTPHPLPLIIDVRSEMYPAFLS